MRFPANALRPLLLGAAVLLHPPAALAAGEKDKEEAKANEALRKDFLDAYASAGADEKARARAVEGLSKAPDALKVDLLAKTVLPGDDSPRVQTSAVSVLRTVKDEEALKALVAFASPNNAWTLRAPVLEALGARSNVPVVLEALRKVLKGSEAKAIAAAVFALAETHPPEALEDVKRVTEHTAWQVRLATLDFLGRLRDPKTLPLLVDRLEVESGRLNHEVVETLRLVSGKDYGKDLEKWKAYLAGGEAAAAAAGRKPADPAAGSGGRAVATGTAPVAPTYYGQPVYSDRVVFVIDVSLSMNEEMVIDRETLVRETGAVVSGSDAESKALKEAGGKEEGELMPLEWWKIKTRMDFARAQLKYAISTLKRDQYFDVVWFSDSVKTWQGRLVPARPGIKVKAADWIDALECEGGTNTWGGLTKALNIVGKGSEEENFTHGADTLYFLSDGEPSKGDVVDKDQIVAAIDRIHKVRRVKIHVVQIGTSVMPFMKRLADATGGTFKFFNAKGSGR